MDKQKDESYLIAFPSCLHRLGFLAAAAEMCPQDSDVHSGKHSYIDENANLSHLPCCVFQSKIKKAKVKETNHDSKISQNFLQRQCFLYKALPSSTLSLTGTYSYLGVKSSGRKKAKQSFLDQRELTLLLSWLLI